MYAIRLQSAGNIDKRVNIFLVRWGIHDDMGFALVGNAKIAPETGIFRGRLHFKVFIQQGM